jgi:hypothetical protein
MASQIEDRHHKFSVRIGEKTAAVLPYREDGDRVILKAPRGRHRLLGEFTILCPFGSGSR